MATDAQCGQIETGDSVAGMTGGINAETSFAAVTKRKGCLIEKTPS